MRIVRIFQKEVIENPYTDEELLSGEETDFINKWKESEE
jgi:hypothetical protein